MACHRYDDGLHQAMLVQEVTYLVSGVISVHKRHVQVHQDQLVAAFLVHVHPHVLSHHPQSFLAVESHVAVLLSVDACSTAQDY